MTETARQRREAIKVRRAWETLCGFPRPFPFAWSKPPPGWDQAVGLLNILVFNTNNESILACEACRHDNAQRYTAFVPVLKDSIAKVEQHWVRILMPCYDVWKPIEGRDRKYLQHMAMAYFFQQARKEDIPVKRAKYLVATVFGFSESTVRDASREFPNLQTANRGTRDIAEIQSVGERALATLTPELLSLMNGLRDLKRTLKLPPKEGFIIEDLQCLRETEIFK